MSAVRYGCVLKLADERHVLELAAGEVQRGVQVGPDGRATAAEGSLEVPPWLVAGRAPATHAKWAIEAVATLSGRTFPFTFTRATGEVFSLGRHDSNAVRVPTDALARRNTGFFVDATGAVWVNDFASPQGTWLDGLKVTQWARVGDAGLRAGSLVEVKLVVRAT